MCEQSAHLLRASELCRRVTRNHPSDDLLSACRAFDNAVEFAAFEGVSIAEAISEYLRDTDPRIAEVLRPVVQPGARPALTKSLPVLPSAAAKLMKISSENASVRELEAIAGSDPVLAARLLGVANSAIFGRTAEIRSLKQAVLRLGIPLARRTLLSACFGKLFASAHLVRIRRHSQTVAALSHELAIKSGADSESAYLAGLVHDTGRIVIHCATAQLQANVNALIEAGFPCVYAETLILARTTPRWEPNCCNPGVFRTTSWKLWRSTIARKARTRRWRELCASRRKNRARPGRRAKASRPECAAPQPLASPDSRIRLVASRLRFEKPAL